MLEELSIDELLAADAEGEEGEAGSEEVPKQGNHGVDAAFSSLPR